MQDATDPMSNPTDLIRRLADEVEAELRHRHAIDRSQEVHPITRRRFDRDMLTVYEARAWIEEHGDDPHA